MGDLIAKDRELRGEMQDILALAKKEKRQLTDEEQARFNTLKEERSQIEMEVEASREIRTAELPTDQIEKRFAKVSSAIVTQGGATKLEVRDAMVTEVGINDSQVPVLLKSIIKPLQAKFILNELGMEVMNGVHGEPVWSYQGIITASVEGENTEVKLSQLDFTALRSKPKRLAISVPVSNRAINQSNYNLYSVVMSALGEACARKLNEVVLSDTAVGELTGLFNGLGAKNKIQGALDWAGVVDLEAAVLNNNVEVERDRCAYVLGTKEYATLKKTVIEKGDSRMVLDPLGHTLNGYKLLVSNYVKENTALFGDFSQSGVAYFGGASLVVDPYTLARQNATLFTLNMDVDVIRFRKEAFASMAIKTAVAP